MKLATLGLTTRYIFLARHPRSLRGTRAEFLHFGVPVTRYEEPLEALADLAHDPHAALVIAAEAGADDEQFERILELAGAIPDRSLYLAAREGTSARTISAAARAGVRATLALPLTPHGLRSAVVTHPGVRPEDRKSSVRTAIARLRRRLRDLDPAADFIQTVQFAGYCLTA